MLISILGNNGTGKTLLLTYIATKSTRTVYSNYKLKLPHYKHLDVKDLLNLQENIDVFIDEGYTWLESRTSTASLNRYLSYILFQSRKRTIDIYLTAQMFSTVDKRFRQQSDVIVKCQRINDNFHYWFYIVGTNIMRTFVFPYETAKEYFPLYDTYQIIEPSKSTDLEFKLMMQNPKALFEKVKELSKELEKEFPINEKTQEPIITHDTVKSALLFNGHHIGYEKYVYLYLKRLIAHNYHQNKQKGKSTKV